MKAGTATISKKSDEMWLLLQIIWQLQVYDELRQYENQPLETTP